MKHRDIQLKEVVGTSIVYETQGHNYIYTTHPLLLFQNGHRMWAGNDTIYRATLYIVSPGKVVTFMLYIYCSCHSDHSVYLSSHNTHTHLVNAE